MGIFKPLLRTEPNLIFPQIWERYKLWKLHWKIVDMVEEDSWLVVSTPLKNISENGNLPQIGMKI